MIKHIPYTVIGGYLGAGKTTLLNNLLRHSQGRRLAVLVNDFGAINIDADLVVSHDGETINLASGCICCSLADGFMTALARLRDHAERIDHIIVEASGVADPVKIGQYGAILRYDLDGVIVLADAEQIRTRAANKYVGEAVIRQLRGADLLVLNKADLVGPDGLAEVRAWLAEVAPGVRIAEATYGRVPLEILLGARRDEQPVAAFAQESEHAQHEGEHTHQELYETRSLTFSEPLARASIEALAARLPEGVLRAKGFVHVAEDPAYRYLFQLVGRRWTLTQGEPWGDAAPETKLVFIGLRGSMTLVALDQLVAMATTS
jgi:G3E family GTPase